MAPEATVYPARILDIGRPYRLTAARQSLAVVAISAVAGVAAGFAGLLSALLGGSIGLAGLLVFALVIKGGEPSAGGAVRRALRAEAAKIIAVVALLWASFAIYRDMVVLAFMAAFAVSVLLSGFAFAVSDQ